MELNLVKHKKNKSTNSNNIKANLSVIFAINLKMTFASPGVIIAFLIHFISLIAILLVETTSGIQTQNIGSIGNYKIIFYVVSVLSTIFFVMMMLLFLFKKQKKSGIHSIELRAGLAVWKSYILRVLVATTIITIANILVLIGVAIMGLLFTVPTELYKAFPYSQVAFIIFLAIIMILILLPIFIYSSTMVGTLMATVLMFVFSLSPIFASIRYSFSGKDAEDDYALKFNVLNEFYENTKNDENVKKIFNDEQISEVDSRSKLVTTLEENLAGYQSGLSSFNLPSASITSKFKQFYTSNNSQESSSTNRYNSWDLVNKDKEGSDFLSTNFKSLIWDTIITNDMYLGQVNYDYSFTPSVNKDARNKKSILEDTPIKSVLDELFDSLKNNQDKIDSKNKNEIPTMFLKKYNYNSSEVYKTKKVSISDFANQLEKYSPKYANLISTAAKIYDKYSAIFNEQQTNIFKNTNPIEYISGSSSNKKYALDDYYTGDFRANLFVDDVYYKPFEGGQYNYYYKVPYDFFSEYNNRTKQYEDQEEHLGDTGLKALSDEEKETINKNQEVAEIYKKFPEITILNWLIVNLWYESFTIAVDSVDELYSYYVSSKNGSKLTFDVFRHFAVMSSGLFANSSLNDSYNNTDSKVLYQGKTSSIKNILDYEKYLPQYNKNYAVQKPFLTEGKVIYKNAFIIPLAYAIYLLLASPLYYLGYMAYKRKIRT